ncbi:MAG: winged helix-turn-helix transcriptional regulator [Bacteroidia bacterium]|nr:winged helix-turn-helix transcriptional regulator [Bacteroidia bacterium]
MANQRNVFDTKSQQSDVAAKIVVGLERISEAFRVLLWEHGKTSGLSPIQIQILIFIQYHSDNLCGVSYLAKEFNLSKPTVSDAVKSLQSKGYVTKEPSSSDSRSHIIMLTQEGRKIAKSVEGFALPIKDKIDQLNDEEQLDLLDHITKIVYRLNRSGIITVQRTCYACKYYESSENGHYCNLLKSPLANSDIRIDCPEFEVR